MKLFVLFCAMFATVSCVKSMNATEQDIPGGYRFKYYAATHEGAEETYGGEGVIFISPTGFGFDTHPELLRSDFVQQLVATDRHAEWALKRNQLNACVASRPAQDSIAAFPLLMKPFALSRAGIGEKTGRIGLIQGVDSAFDLRVEVDGGRLIGASRGYHVYFGFSADRLELEAAPGIALADCVEFAQRNADYVARVRNASGQLWDAHSDRIFESAFWHNFEKRTSEGMAVALKRAITEAEWKPEKGASWAMQALIYGNAVDFMAMEPKEAREKAEAALEKALELAPQSNLTHAAYGLVMRNRDTEGAEVRLRKCTANEPEYAECHNLLGDLLRKTGRPEQAGEVYLEGLERWPDNGELHVSYALYLQETGRASEAIDYLREFVVEQPNFPRGHWHLAVMLYEEGGDLDEAREHAGKALEMDSKIWNGERLLLELDRLR